MVKTKEQRPMPLMDAQRRREPAKPGYATKQPVSSISGRSSASGASSRVQDGVALLSSAAEGGASARARAAASMQRSLGNARVGRVVAAPTTGPTSTSGAGLASVAAPDTPTTGAKTTSGSPLAAPAAGARRVAAGSVPATSGSGSVSTARTPAAPSTPGISAAKAAAPGVGPATAKGGSAGTGGTAIAARPDSGGTGGGKRASRRSPSEAIAPAVGAIHHRAGVARNTHSAPGVAVGSAQAAGVRPETEQARSSAAETVENLNNAKTDGVKPDDFKAQLKDAIHKATPQPKTESEADDLIKSGAKKASGVVGGQLSAQSSAASEPLKAAEVDAQGDKPPAPPELKPEQVGAAPAPVSAAPVVPAPLPPEQLDYSSDRAPTDRAMAESNVTKEQLAEGNEPQFGSTLAARSSAESHESAVPAQYRKSEASVQEQAHQAAQKEITTGLASIHNTRGLHIGKVAAKQSATAAKNLAERQRIKDTVTAIRDQTRTDVETILKSMEEGAEKIFEPELSRAEQAFQDVFEEAKGGVGTWLTTWGSDWEELIKNSLEKARNAYLALVDGAVDKVAQFVDEKLKAARARVAEGRKQVQTFVNGLDASVKQFGEEALETVSADFDALGGEIDQRRDALVNKLTEQYKASYDRMSAMEEKLREENKSLWQRVYDATVGVIKQILAFKDMLLSVLAKAAAVVGDIIAHPIRFLGNLVSGVMQGLKNFMSNIGTHLLKGLMDWLFGALAGAGLQLPDSFDLKGIISIVLQVLGLTYANFRARAVAIVGEPVVAGLEKAAGVIRIVMTKGISGLWEFIKEKVSDLKSMVMDAIFDFIKERVIIAGITWIIGLLNPASAFFKACKAIYDIVSFFINRGSQILALVNAVLDSMAAISKGAIGVAATAVENALAKAIPVAIGFLAGLLGLGDISGTVKKTIDKAQTPVNKAIDWVINTAVKAGKGLLKALGVGKEGSFVGRTASRLVGGDPDAPPEERLERAEREISPQVQQLLARGVSGTRLRLQLGLWRVRYALTGLQLEKKGDTFQIHAWINPERRFANGVQMEDASLAALVRRIVLEEIASHPTVRGWRGRPTQPVTSIRGGIEFPAAALQLREQLQTHQVIAAPPFIAVSKGPISTIAVGGGTVEERRARQSPSAAPLERVLFPGGASYTPGVVTSIKESGLSEPAFALNMRKLVQEGTFEPGLTDPQRAAVRRTTWLIYGTESARNIGNIAHAPMATGLVEAEQRTWAQTLTGAGPATGGTRGLLPATMIGLPGRARTLEGQLQAQGVVPGLTARQGAQEASGADVQELVTREADLVIAWVNTRLGGSAAASNVQVIETTIRVYVREYYRSNPRR